MTELHSIKDGASVQVDFHDTRENDDDEDEFIDEDLPIPPDGGWGWIVVFSSFMIHVIADGITYTFGIFYVEFLKFFKQSNAKTAWILSILVGITLGIGPVSSALTNRFGCRAVTIVGGLMAAGGLLISIFAPNVETLFLTVGILTGSGFGFMYLPAIVSVSMYFEKKRAFATGIAVCGSGVGTFGMAPLLQYLVELYSWKGAMLLSSGIILHCLIFGTLFRPLDPPKQPKKKVEVNGNKVQTCNGDVSVTEAAYKKAIVPQNRSVEAVKRESLTPGDTIHLKVTANGNCQNANNNATEMFDSQNSLSKSHLHHHHGPMYRKDVLYSGSLLSLTKSSRSLYTTSMTSIPRRMSAASPQPSSKPRRCFSRFSMSEEVRFAFQEMLDLSIMKEPVYIMFVVSNFLTSIGFIVPFVYTKDRAIHEGLSDDSAAMLLSVIGISNMFGRVVIGYISDKPFINRVYLYNVLLTICGLSTGLSFVCDDFITMSVYCSIFGITAGAYVGLTSVILADLFGLAKLTNGFGLLLLFQGAASLIGPPIAGSLYDVTKSYDAGYGVAGTCIAISGLILFFIPLVDKYDQRDPSSTQMPSNKISSPPVIVCTNDEEDVAVGMIKEDNKSS